jgi:hypothetical protein
MSQSLVYSSKDDLPNRLLLGMAFSATDAIVGSDGYKQFLKVRERQIRPGMDGAYVVINAQGDTFEVGTDFGGYGRIYFYECGDLWAISNSFYDLSEHLKANNLPMSAYLPGAAGMQIDGALGQQPLSDRTPISEIRLLARSQMIRISPMLKKGQLQRVPAPNDAEGFAILDTSYEDGMRNYLKTWIGRYVAILNSDVHLTCDVTGGLDSRTNLALLLRAAAVSGNDVANTVHFNSNPGLPRDRMISEKIATHFGFEIGNSTTKSFPRAAHKTSYISWKTNYLHSYWPVYFLSVSRSDTHFWTGGASGETHRWISGVGLAPTIEELVERRRASFPNQDQFDALLSDVSSCISEMTSTASQPKNSFVCHYRNFRERFHHGRRSQNTYSVSPLAGAGLSAVSRHVQDDFLKTQRIFADLIYNSTPDLLGFEFEKGYENFAGKTPELLVDLAIQNSKIDSSGRVFHNDNAEETGKYKFVQELEMLREEFELSVPTALETEMVSSFDIEVARHVLSNATKAKRFKHPAVAKPVATTVLAAAVARWT